MKKLFLLCLVITILFSSCATWHIGWAERHKEKICQICTASDSTSNVINIVPDNSLPDRNDSALIIYIRNCNELANIRIDSMYNKDLRIQLLSEKIRIGQPAIIPLINPPKTVQVITNTKTVVNPVNVANEKKIAELTVKNQKQEAKIIAKTHANGQLWKWIVILGGIIALYIVLKIFGSKIPIVSKFI